MYMCRENYFIKGRVDRNKGNAVISSRSWVFVLWTFSPVIEAILKIVL